VPLQRRTWREEVTAMGKNTTQKLVGNPRVEGRSKAMEREAERIQLLVDRDGFAAARTWVERTLEIYREAIHSDKSHASKTDYRPLFEDSIREFEQWLAEHPSDT
jgi:hypothetical protein